MKTFKVVLTSILVIFIALCAVVLYKSSTTETIYLDLNPRNFGWLKQSPVDEFTQSDLEEIIEMINRNLSDERVQRKNQLDLEDINKGDIVYLVHEGVQQEYKIMIVNPPFWVGVECLYTYVDWEDGVPESDLIRTNYCTDAGLVRYTGNLNGWNAVNYIRESEEDSLSFKEVDRLVKDMECDRLYKEYFPQVEYDVVDA